MGKQRPAYATTQLFGLILIAAAMIAVIIVELLFLDAEESFWPVAVASVLFAGVVWRFDALWARIIGLVGTLAIGGAMFFFAFGIFQPLSPIEFIVGLLFVIGVLTALAGGVMTLIVGRKREPGPSEKGRRFRQIAVGFIGVASVVSIVGFFLTRSVVSDDEAAGAATLEMVDFEFSPLSTSVSSDQSLVVVNRDLFAHDFTLDEYDIYAYTGPGSEAAIDLSSVPAGTYTFVCSLHTNPSTGEGMTGQLTIEG